MAEISELNDALAKLSDLRNAIGIRRDTIAAATTKLLAPLAESKLKLEEEQKEYELMREFVLRQLKANKIQSWKNDRVTAYITPKVRITVEDEVKVRTWLIANKFNLDEYQTEPKLDLARIEPLQIARMDEDGEIIDGLNLEKREILNVRDVKAKANG